MIIKTGKLYFYLGKYNTINKKYIPIGNKNILVQCIYFILYATYKKKCIIIDTKFLKLILNNYHKYKKFEKKKKFSK